MRRLIAWGALVLTAGIAWVSLLRMDRQVQPLVGRSVANASQATSVSSPRPVMTARARGVVRIEQAGRHLDEALPEPPMGFGSFPQGLHRSPSGTLWVVGVERAEPGPATFGVLYARAADGQWSTALREPGVEWHSVAGDGEHLYLGGLGGVWVLTGTQLRRMAFPDKRLTRVWAEAGKYFAAQEGRSAVWELLGEVFVPTRRTAPAPQDGGSSAFGGVRFQLLRSPVDGAPGAGGEKQAAQGDLGAELEEE